MYFRRVIITDQGVYHPMALLPRVVLYVAALIAIVVAALAGRLTFSAAAMYFALIGVPFAWALYNYLKYGKLGRPSVSLVNGTFSMDRPQSTDGMVHFTVRELKSVLVYGMRGKRIYRFSRADGAFDEVSPLWGRNVEAAVVAFILNHLSPGVEVTVEEPQSLFSSMQGYKR